MYRGKLINPATSRQVEVSWFSLLPTEGENRVWVQGMVSLCACGACGAFGAWAHAETGARVDRRTGAWSDGRTDRQVHGRT